MNDIKDEDGAIKTRTVYERFTEDGLTDQSVINNLTAQLSEERDKVRRLTEALTPSIEKKGEFTARFSFDTPAEGKVFVPWVTVKEIMAAILAASALSTEE